jgi:hypothetical protein
MILRLKKNKLMSWNNFDLSRDPKWMAELSTKDPDPNRGFFPNTQFPKGSKFQLVETVENGWMDGRGEKHIIRRINRGPHEPDYIFRGSLTRVFDMVEKPPMHWPSVIGARDAEGGICVDARKSRSKYCRTRLVFFQPPTRLGEGYHYELWATQVDWSKDPYTVAILVTALREIVQTKLDSTGFVGGGVVAQVIVGGTGGPRIYLYEAGPHETLWPRYWWRIPYSGGFGNAIAMAIRMETLSDKLVGNPDPRLAVELESHFPSEDRPRFTNDWAEYVADLLAAKEK